ncbi:MAG TPA: YceD family protein [Terriglobales bacterium]|nr:YceD family protein [Terriglobales bacterium]
MFARHFIDSLDFARNGKELRGEIPVAEMPRLQDMLAAPEGQVRFVLRGLHDKDGHPVLELALDGSCQLRCQRCLQGMEYPLKMLVHLRLVTEEPTEAHLVEGEDEQIDSILADSHLDVVALIEEEILLGLPLAPKHEFGTCQAALESVSREEQSPFAVLRGLKK